MKGDFYMNKYFVLLSILLVIITNPSKKEEVIIPEEAIRFRVIAASNTIADQQTKQKVKKSLQEDLTNLLATSTSISTTRNILKTNLAHLNQTIATTLQEDHNLTSYKLHYGLNYFPAKKYKGITYQEGYYESLVVSLGNAEGTNWWCVLFPPLCLLDDNGTTKEVEYKLLVKELLQKYLPNQEK